MRVNISHELMRWGLLPCHYLTFIGWQLIFIKRKTRIHVVLLYLSWMSWMQCMDSSGWKGTSVTGSGWSLGPEVHIMMQFVARRG